MAKTLKYDHVKYLILNAIAQDKLAPGDCLPSERAMRMRLQISQISFRRALKELEAQGIVFRMERKGTFLKQALTRAEPADRVLWLNILPRGTTQKPQLPDGMFSERLHARCIGVLKRYETIPGPELLAEAQGSAGILATGELTAEWIRFLNVLKPKPMLVLGDYPCNRSIPAMWIDHARMAREAVVEFARRGARNIGFIDAIASYHPSAKMLAGYRAGLEECGLPRRDEWVLIPDRNCEGGQVAEYLRSYGNDLDALLVERYPYGAVLAAKWSGDCVRSMPLAVLDVDPAQRTDCRFAPGTLLATCAEDIGERLADELFRRILNPDDMRDVELRTALFTVPPHTRKN